MQRAGRRYARDIIIAAIIYAVAVIAAAFVTRNFELPRWALIAAALAPLAPATLMLRAYLVFVNPIDEFQRRIQAESIAIAAGFICLGSFAFGFLEEWADFPHIPLLWVFPVFMGAFGLAQCFVRMRYK